MDMLKKIPDVNPYREISLVVSRQFLKKRLIDSLKNTILEKLPRNMTQKPEGFIIDTNIKV
jgi:LysR family hydrogen peroxide-inducible transcriptional activator